MAQQFWSNGLPEPFLNTSSGGNTFWHNGLPNVAIASIQSFSVTGAFVTGSPSFSGTIGHFNVQGNFTTQSAQFSGSVNSTHVSGNFTTRSPQFSGTVHRIYVARMNSAPFKVYIGGNDVSHHVHAPSIIPSSQLGGRGAGVFDLVSTLGIVSAYLPAVESEVIIENSAALRIFAGQVERTTQKVFTGTSGLVVTRVECKDWGFWLEDRYVTKEWPAGETLENILIWIVANVLDGTGITLGTIPAITLEALSFPHRQCTVVLNEIMAQAALQWRLDYYKVLHVFDAATGYAPSAISLTANNREYLRDVDIIVDDVQKATRVGVITSRHPDPKQVDSRTAASGAGGTSIPMRYMSQVGYQIQGPTPPFVTINNSPANPGDFTYDSNTATTDVTAANPGDTIATKYLTDFPAIVWVGDSSSTRREYVYEAKDLPDSISALELATAILNAMQNTPTKIEFNTDYDGNEPGMLMTVNDFGISGNYLIESVNGSEYGKRNIRYRIRLTDTTWLSPDAIADRLRLKQRLQMEPLRHTFETRFMVAETIEGITNPGALLGQGTHALGILTHNGWLRDVRLEWRTPGAGSVEVTVYHNGVLLCTISSGMVFNFPTEPFEGRIGDEITMEVTVGDATAMDGNLVLTWYKR